MESSLTVISLRSSDVYDPLQIFLRETGSPEIGVLVCELIFSEAELPSYAACILFELPPTSKVLNIGYRDRIEWGFSYRMSDIGGDIGDTRAYQAFISETIYNEILINKSWFNVIDIIYLIKMM